ncbi:DUF4365 domain-containing protein [Kytococcus sedentarius]|uniref:DUF4365 domain-containing protein n=1 Tax=Kytococcus sedentarius TaxID=1276 RepID=UPI00384F4ADD
MAPLRPPSHQLETESRRAFERTLPHSWASHAPENDYGIDLSVDITNSENVVTGEVFKVQLKATANQTRPSVRVKNSHLEYWRSLDSPVLLVLYTSATQTLYYVWAHSIPIGDHKSTSVTFNNSQILTPDSWEKIHADISTIRHLKAGHLAAPIAVNLTVAKSVSPGFEIEIRESFLRLFEDGRVLRLDNDDPLRIDVEVTAETLYAALPTGIASQTMPWAGEGDQSRDGHELARTIGWAIFSLLARTGNAREACRLVEIVGWDPWAEFYPHDLEQLTQVLITERRIDLGLRLAEHYVNGDETNPSVAQAGISVLAELFDILDAESIDKMLSIQRRIIHLERHSKYPTRAAAPTYSLGQFYWRLGMPMTSLLLYDEAARIDPTYLGRDYWVKERAGLLFDSGYYQEAADAYSHVARLSQTTGGHDAGDLAVLQMDALLHSGELSAARRLADSCPDPASPSLQDALTLMERALADLPVVAEIRLPGSSIVGEECARILSASRLSDPMHWVRESRNLTDFHSLLMAALLTTNIPICWALATASAHIAGEPSAITSPLHRQGRELSGAEFTSMVRRLLNEKLSPKVADQVSVDIERTYRTRHLPLTMREVISGDELRAFARDCTRGQP